MMSTSCTSSKNAHMANKYDRVVLLVYMDCFLCQVEERLNPLLKNQPLAVIHDNSRREEGIFAVNYAARARGVHRRMRHDEAKEQCPEIQLVKVPIVQEKFELTKYREAAKEVSNVLQRFTTVLETASVDEAYLDITDAVNKRFKEMNDGVYVLQPQDLENTYAVGYKTIGEFVTTLTSSFITNLANDYISCNEADMPTVRRNNVRLLIGASIASEIRGAIQAETSYECSAGIAHNKMLAKVACGINKPNKQTILLLEQINDLYKTIPVGKMKGLGSEFGKEVCERLNICYLGQLIKFTEAELQRIFDCNIGTWLYNICRGIDFEDVTPRFYSKSIRCCKMFPGRNNIMGLKTLQHWLDEMANELHQKLEEDFCEKNRLAKQVAVTFIQDFDGEEVSSSRSAPLQCYDAEILAKTCLEIIRVNTKQFFRSETEGVLNNPIKFLGISVGKFETISKSQNNIQEIYAQQTVRKQKIQNDLKNETQTLFLKKYKENHEDKSGDLDKIEIDDDSLQQLPTKNVESLHLNDTVPQKNEAILVPEADNRPKNNLLKKIRKETKFLKTKNLFSNTLRNNPHIENNKSHANENNTNQVYCEPEYNLSKHIHLNCILQNELATSTKGACSNRTNEIIMKTTFKKALEKLPANKLASHSSNQNLERNNSNCDKVIDLLNEITENYEINFAFQNSGNVSVLNDGPINKKRKHEKTSALEENNQTGFRLQYAESAISELDEKFQQLKNCSKCGAKILNDPLSMQIHEDYHIAQELSKQQRQEYRNEIRSKIISMKSPSNCISNKKTKKVNNVIMKTSTDIKRFLMPTSFLTSRSSSLTVPSPENGTYNVSICDICKLPIKIDEVSLHKDFHMAKDLQRQLNQLEVRTVDVVKKSTSDSSRKSPMKVSTRHSPVNTKSITHFFPKSNT